MTVLAHISDLHLLEHDHTRRSGIERTRLAFLSSGAPLDAHERMRAARTTLMMADRSGADHIVITGDLTEDGTQAQFEAVAEVLHDSGVSPDRITMVPGNHDGYAQGCSGFLRALEGPLANFRETCAPGAVTVLEDAVLQPISTVVDKQWVTQAGGVLRDSDLQAITRLASDGITKRRTHVVAQHHPFAKPSLPLRMFDGTENGAALRDLLLERNSVHVLHGHVHRDVTHTLCEREHAQVFSTSSVRDGGRVLRMYKAEDGRLRELCAAQPGVVRTRVPLGGRPALAWG
jgi:3',5'-cyclic-AMP phosphodiesterase